MTLALVCSRRNVLAATLVLVLGGVAAHGQQRPSGGGPPGGPLLIDFTAVTADGKPVADLTPADITIRIGGRARTVTSLELKKVEPAAAPAGGPAAAAGDITPPFATNEAKPAAAGRSFLIIVDTESLPPATETAMASAIEALLKGLSGADRVALSTAPRDTAQVGFGTSLAEVRKAVAALKGQRGASVTAGETVCRSSQTLALLNSLIRPLAGSETPTSVVFIGAGLSTAGSKGTGDGGGPCEVVQGHYQAIADTSAEARANVYVVQGDSAAMGRNDGLESLAGVTGAGQVMRVVADGFAPRVLADASTYWVATVAPDPVDRPGQAQPLQVKVVRDGVTVRARAFAAVSKPSAAPAQAKSGSPSPKDMIATTAKFTDLQLRATAIFQRGQTDKMNVMIFAEPVDPTVKITAMRVGYFDQANKGASLDAPQVATYPITTVLPLGVGQYRIRVAATDASGKSGAVDVNINTSLTVAGAIRMSDLLLVVPRSDGKLGPRLIFSSEETISVMFELYGQLGADTKIKLGFELAKSDTGAAIGTFQPIGINPTPEPDKFQIVGEIPIATLAPGDYVIRGIGQMEGQPEGKVIRTFRKVAK